MDWHLPADDDTGRLRSWHVGDLAARSKGGIGSCEILIVSPRVFQLRLEHFELALITGQATAGPGVACEKLDVTKVSVATVISR